VLTWISTKAKSRSRKSQAELRGGRQSIKKPKSQAGVRTVAVPRILLGDLRVHLERYAEAGPEGVVFVGPMGGRLRRHNFRRVWLAALADSKITKKDVHFQTFDTPATTLRPGPARPPKN
jgi:hypothetical protein